MNVRRALEALLNLFFPPKCPFCGRVLDAVGVCARCRGTLPWTNEKDSLRQDPDGFRCAAPLWYEGAVRDTILRLKFRDGVGAAEPLGQLIAQCAAERLSGAFDTVTWVPISRRRYRRRGYDQAALLAESACRMWDTRPVRLLTKPVDNPAQSGLDTPEARRTNVQGVYRLSAPVEGRRILLIDDVCTTGATLRACASVLYQGGAASVVCAAAARAGRHHVCADAPRTPAQEAPKKVLPLCNDVFRNLPGF